MVLCAHAAAACGLEEHKFTLLATDYALTVFGAELARTVHAEAPGVRLRFQQPPTDVAEDTAALLRAADGLLLTHGVITGFPAVELFTDRWAFLVAEANDEVGDRLTMEDLARLP